MRFLKSLLLGGVVTAVAAAQSADRPQLQIINGSSQTADIFWLKSATERVPNGSAEPGKDTIIATTLGHRFAVRKNGRMPAVKLDHFEADVSAANQDCHYNRNTETYPEVGLRLDHAMAALFKSEK